MSRASYFRFRPKFSFISRRTCSFVYSMTLILFHFVLGFLEACWRAFFLTACHLREKLWKQGIRGHHMVDTHRKMEYKLLTRRPEDKQNSIRMSLRETWDAWEVQCTRHSTTLFGRQNGLYDGISKLTADVSLKKRHSISKLLHHTSYASSSYSSCTISGNSLTTTSSTTATIKYLLTY